MYLMAILTNNDPTGRKAGKWSLVSVLFSEERTFLASFFVIKILDMQTARKLMQPDCQDRKKQAAGIPICCNKELS